MREVSSRIVGSLLTLMRQKKVPLDPILAGLRIELDARGNPTDRVDWDDYVEMIERLTATVGDDLLAGWGDADADMQGIAGFFVSSRTFFHFAFSTLYGSFMPHMRLRVEDLGGNRTRLTAEIPEPYRASADVLRVSSGGFRTFGQFVGDPRPITVEAEITPRRGVYTLTFPPARSLAARLERAARAFLMPAVAEQVATELERNRRDVQHAFAELEATYARLSLVHDVAQALGRVSDVDGVAEVIGAALRDRLGCTDAHVLIETTDGGDLHVLRGAAAEGQPTRRYALETRGRHVGWLDVSGYAPRERDDVLPQLLPWFALSLDRARYVRVLQWERARLAAETELRAQTERALTATLGALPGAAFVVEADGSVRGANAAGEAALAQGGASTRSRLLRAARSREPGYVVTPLVEAGGPWLVVSSDVGDALAARLASAAERWSLSERQREVLAGVVRGRSNKEIAADLACAENTVEYHLTTTLKKVGVDSRAALTHRFWTGQ